MLRVVEIRNVPDALYREAKTRAALAGVSLSDYLLEQLKRTLSRPSREEILRRVQRSPLIEPQESVAAIVRQARQERSDHLLQVTGSITERSR